MSNIDILKSNIGGFKNENYKRTKRRKMCSYC